MISKLLLSSTLLIAAGAPIAAQVVSPAAGNRLADTEWRLVSFASPRAETPVLENTTVTLKFGSDGRAGGSGGCNTYGANYRVRGNSLSFGPIISTKRACLDQDANIQEQRYLRALEGALSFRITGNRLTTNPGRGGTLNFVSASDLAPSQQQYDDQTNPVALLASFYNAVNLRDYERAYRYWESPPAGLREFSLGYRDTENVQLIVQPPTNFEGAAGSSSAEVPTVIVSRQRNGSQRTFAGCYVMRKSNLSMADNPGAGVWRIYRGSLSPAAASAAIPQLLAQACRK